MVDDQAPLREVLSVMMFDYLRLVNGEGGETATSISMLAYATGHRQSFHKIFALLALPRNVRPSNERLIKNPQTGVNKKQLFTASFSVRNLHHPGHLPYPSS